MADVKDTLKTINYVTDGDIATDKPYNLPSVSIVIQNKNGKEHTIHCINSLRGLKYPKQLLEIIVVDSASTDNSVFRIKEAFAEMESEGWYNLKLLALKYDKGVPHSYNQALKAINPGYRYLWKLDNDVIVDKNSLIELIKIAEVSDHIGLTNGKIYYFSKPDTIWSIGAKIYWLLGTNPHIGKNQKDIGQFNTVSTFDHLVGCSVLIKRSLIDKIGHFFEGYFLFYDDTELSVLSTKHGYSNVYVPSAKIWHKVHGTTKSENPKFTYYRTRNAFIFMKRNAGRMYYLFQITSCLCFPYHILKNIHRKENLKSYLKGFKEGILYQLEHRK